MVGWEAGQLDSWKPSTATADGSFSAWQLLGLLTRGQPKRVRKALYRQVRLEVYQFRVANTTDSRGWVRHEGRFLYHVQMVMPILKQQWAA
jgi:hypothetical protein